MLPFLNATKNKSKKYVVSFQGINYGEGYKDGEFPETKNISTDVYPCVSQRYQRVNAGSYTAPTSVHTKEGLLVIDGTSAIYEGAVVGSVSAGRKQMEVVGNYVLIFPDKKFFNVATKEFGNMEATASGAGYEFTTTAIKGSGFSGHCFLGGQAKLFAHFLR